MKVFALVGRSGSGKSFRAQFVAHKYHIPLIIDDGLLIKGENIIAGKSAKQDPNFLTAVKTALFQDNEHYNNVMSALIKEKARKILIIGTSEKMIDRITQRLNLPKASTIIHIEEIASKDEIEIAMRVRYTEGKHVIPVPPVQVTRSYPSIVYDSVKDIFRRRFRIRTIKNSETNEKTVVKPEFSKHKDEESLSINTLKQMISQCLTVYNNNLKIENIDYACNKDGYDINISLRTPVPMDNEQQMELQEYIGDSLERYGGILVNQVIINLNLWNSSY